MEFRTVGRPTHGRRSKLDIVGDILRVVAEGAEKPTNIIFRANLTWPLTVAYLEALLRHEMIRVESVGSKPTYHVTAKGSALLKSYIDTAEAAAELELDTIDTALLSKVTARKARVKAEDPPNSLESIRVSLENEGYHPAPIMRRGLSGVEHNFDLAMESEKGARLGYILSEQGTVGDVIRAFILQTDCEFQVRVLCLKQPDAQAKELADSYSVALVYRP